MRECLIGLPIESFRNSFRPKKGRRATSRGRTIQICVGAQPRPFHHELRAICQSTLPPAAFFLDHLAKAPKRSPAGYAKERAAFQQIGGILLMCRGQAAYTVAKRILR